MTPADAPPVRSPLRFSKMHGAGNDFVVLDLRRGGAAPDPGFAALLADRHRGVGCDQILTIEPARSAGAVASYRIWNSDGSPSRQCGNGARCVAAWLVRDGATASSSFELDSPGATHAVHALGEGRYSVAMGVPAFDPVLIPLAGFATPADTYQIPLPDAVVGVGAVSMGNPHALIEVPDVVGAAVAAVGAALQESRAFPQSVNVGFAEVLDRASIRLRVYERGVGETLACGSGACAAAAVLMRRGRVDRSISVALPGGELQIDWPHDAAEVIMSGPTAFVFEGEWQQ